MANCHENNIISRCVDYGEPPGFEISKDSTICRRNLLLAMSTFERLHHYGVVEIPKNRHCRINVQMWTDIQTGRRNRVCRSPNLRGITKTAWNSAHSPDISWIFVKWPPSFRCCITHLRKTNHKNQMLDGCQTVPSNKTSYGTYARVLHRSTGAWNSPGRW